jgi:tetratricopeptide (TPR) repeat protein
VEAVRELELAVKAGPADTELLQVLAQSCLGANQYSCALEQYQQILQKDPNSSAAHTLAGEALDGLGRTPEAITEFQTAVNIAPKEPNLHFGLGYLYWKSRQYDNAAAWKGKRALVIGTGNSGHDRVRWGFHQEGPKHYERRNEGKVAETVRTSGG